MRSNPARQPAAFPVVVTTFAAAMLAACASPAPTPAPQDAPVQVAAATAPSAASAPRRVCTRERPIGSTMAQTVCRDVDEHGDVADTVETLNRAMTNGNADQMRRTGGH